jgi:virulence factor Mce-like protein
MEQVGRRALEIVLGLVLTLVLVTGVVVIWESFSGAFSDKITVSAQLSQAGDALEQGDIVTYHDVIIGEVTAASGDRSGAAVAKLKIDPKQAAKIPASVSAIAVPASLFGTTRIELVPTSDTSGPRLHAGSLIAADKSPAAEGLQTALANAYTLLTSIHPAELDAALSSLAEALDGQGANLGNLIDRADAYLRRLAPHLPELDDVITSLATVTREIARNTPALLHSISNTLVIAKGILADKQAVAALLGAAPGAIDAVQGFLQPRTVDNAVTIFRNELPVAQALADNPRALADTIAGFKTFADTFATVIDGKSARANLLLTGPNIAELLSVVPGGTGHVFDGISDPPRYTAADCPRYPGADGPNCGSSAELDGSSARMLTTGTDYGGTASSIGSEQEVFTVRSAASKITGLPTAQIPAATDLILGPLLRGTPTVIAR